MSRKAGTALGREAAEAKKAVGEAPRRKAPTRQATGGKARTTPPSSKPARTKGVRTAKPTAAPAGRTRSVRPAAARPDRRSAGGAVLNVGGREVVLQRPGKVLWPGPGFTKADLAAHLVRAAPRMLPHVRGRPLTLLRLPDGIGGHRFFQKDTPGHFPDWIRRCPTEKSDGVTNHPVVDDAAGLVYLAGQGVLEFHGWTSLCDDPARPDRLVFDMDPPAPDLFADAVQGARWLCSLLRRRGAAPHVLMTGSRGVHIVVPLVPDASSQDVNAFADAVARVLVRHLSERYTTEMRKDRRGHRVFVDTLRNRPHQTAILPYSPRARPEGTVALPVPESYLDDPEATSRLATLRDARGWLEGPDPWAGFFEEAVPLRRLLP